MPTFTQPYDAPDHGVATLDAPGDAASQLAFEVGACLPALPVLQAQLQEAIKTVESSVVDVCASFMTIAQQARDAVATSAAMGGRGEREEREGATVGKLMESCSQAFERLLQHIERSSQLIHSTSDRIAHVETGLKDIFGLLASIDDLASDVYVIALNGTIEAARAGAQGAAFGVVAQHTRDLASQARRTSEEIREIVTQVSKQATQTSQSLQHQAAADRDCVAASRAEVAHALADLNATHERLSDTVAQSAATNKELASNISRVVTTMQFQDAAAQRVGHVAHTLGEMHAALQTHWEAAGSLGHEQASHWLDHMSRQYVMHAERLILHDAHGDPSSSDELGDNIELF